MTTIRSVILARQRKWAEFSSIATDRAGYVTDIGANLFQPLNPQTRVELEAGAGQELGTSKVRGKMKALHSSSALACNIFDYWRDRDWGPLEKALPINSPIRSFRFEAPYPSGLAGTPPHLDLAMELTDGSLLAIESKFTEPYTPQKQEGRFSSSYFPDSKGLWQEVGLPRCQVLADDIHAGRVRFARLDAPQLLKHLLGLKQIGRRFLLLVLWYRFRSPAAAQFAKEINLFFKGIDSGLRIHFMPYARFFEDVERYCGTDHQAYRDYNRLRYFAAAEVD